MNMLRDGVNTLASLMKENASDLVTYKRGTDTDDIYATPTEPDDEFEIAEAAGIDSRMRVFIVNVSELPAFVTNNEPLADDLIVNDGSTYRVFAFAGKMTYKHSDSFGIRIRIYTLLM